MARSTPAQNDRGPARSTVLSPAAAAQDCSEGAAAVRALRARTPPASVEGDQSSRPGVSTTARTTARGAAVPSSSQAVSQSTATAPVEARAARRAAPIATRRTDTTGPTTQANPREVRSAARRGADGSFKVTAPCSSSTRSATTSVPGSTPGTRAPPTPATTSGPTLLSRASLAAVRDERRGTGADHPDPGCPPGDGPRLQAQRGEDQQRAHSGGRLPPAFT